MVYYSPDLWRYIKTRTPVGTRRGLDKKLLALIKEYHGEWVVSLLLTMQMNGRGITIDKALEILRAAKYP